MRHDQRPFSPATESASTTAATSTLKAAYEEAKAKGSGPGVPRSALKGLRLKGYQHPFIEFPLWGLEQALADHKARCSGCSGNRTADCREERYSNMLRDKIERLSRD